MTFSLHLDGTDPYRTTLMQKCLFSSDRRGNANYPILKIMLALDASLPMDVCTNEVN